VAEGGEYSCGDGIFTVSSMQLRIEEKGYRRSSDSDDAGRWRRVVTGCWISEGRQVMLVVGRGSYTQKLSTGLVSGQQRNKE